MRVKTGGDGWGASSLIPKPQFQRFLVSKVGGGVLHQMFGKGVQSVMKKVDPIRSKVLGK